ncbi:MAG: 2-amino-4-hydroxy-6-hydroxymethyldihydropteridine diphosphokinase [Ignavibacteriales bacterium]|nr:2-amino-4-hydroxy-6-hydroxymethyldihydropteridine diphosphokinase [Ignavibacteriales bacterium]
MQNIFLSIGSNIGDRLSFLRSALDGINDLPGTSVVKVSSVYETEPVGKKDQQDFLNIVAEVESGLSPEQLLEQLKSLEHVLGRKHSERWGPREIDIDILYADKIVIGVKDFNIPHAEASSRRFVLVPLAEIAADFRDPVLNLTVGELLTHCRDGSAVRKTELATNLQER